MDRQKTLRQACTGRAWPRWGATFALVLIFVTATATAAPGVRSTDSVATPEGALAEIAPLRPPGTGYAGSVVIYFDSVAGNKAIITQNSHVAPVTPEHPAVWIPCIIEGTDEMGACTLTLFDADGAFIGAAASDPMPGRSIVSLDVPEERFTSEPSLLTACPGVNYQHAYCTTIALVVSPAGVLL